MLNYSDDKHCTDDRKLSSQLLLLMTKISLHSGNPEPHFLKQSQFKAPPRMYHPETIKEVTDNAPLDITSLSWLYHIRVYGTQKKYI